MEGLLKATISMQTLTFLTEHQLGTTAFKYTLVYHPSGSNGTTIPKRTSYLM